MGDAYKGLTIRIGADARPLNSALQSIKASTGKVQSDLNRLKKALNMDPSNVRVMQKSLDLMGDKARHSATEMRTLARAAGQAAGKSVEFSTSMGKFEGTVRQAAARYKDIYSESQRIRSEIRRTDEQLETVYDKLKQIVGKEKNLSKGDSIKYVQKLQGQLARGGESAKKAREEVERLLDLGMKRKADGGQGLKMILGYSKGDLEGLKQGWWNLHEASQQYKRDQKNLNQVEDFKKAQTAIRATRAELRGAADDYARMAAKFHSSGGINDAFEKASRSIRRYDENIERARANTERAIESSKAMPHNLEAANARMRAIKTETETVRAKLSAVNEKIRAISSADGFDKMAASSEKVFANLAKTEGEVSDIKYSLSMAKARMDDFNSELSQTKQHGKASAEQIRKIEANLTRATAEVSKYESKLAEAEKRLRSQSMAAEFREARSEARALNAEIVRLNDLSTHTHMFGDFARSIRTAGYGIYSTVTPAIMIAGRYAVQAAEDVDSAYRDMRKTVNGTEEQFEHLKDAAVDFSRTHVTSAETMLEIEAMGGQLGISVENLEAFAHTVSNLDIATNMEAEDIAESLGKMASVMNINVDEYDEFGDALVRLGNNLPVMEGDIMNMTTRYMGMGKVVGMSADEMLAWSAAGIATGQRAEAAGSAMQRFISKVESAVVEGGDALDGFAAVADMTSEDFKKTFETNASQALYAFIQGLADLQGKGKSVNQILGMLKFGNVRDKQLLEGLAQQMANTGDSGQILAKALKMSDEAYHHLSSTMDDGSIEQAGDAAREAERKSEGFSGELGKLRNNAIAAALELSEGLVPLMKIASEAFQEATKWLSDLPDETKTAISAMALLAAAAGPAMVGIGSIGTAGSEMIKHISKFPTAWAKVTMGVKTGDALVDVAGKLSSGFRFMTGDSSKAASAIETMGLKLGEAAKAAGVAKLAIGAIGVGLAVAAISAIVSHYQEMDERAQAAAKASENMYERINRASSNAAQKVSDANKNLVPKIDWESSVRDYQKWIDDLGATYDTLQQKADDTFANSSLIEHYAAQIQDILDLMKENPDGILTAEKQAELAAAVKGYNDATGESITVTNAEKGALADSEGQAIKTGDAFMELANKKKYAAMQQYFSDEFAESYKARIDLTNQLAAAQQKYDDAVNVLNNQDQYSTEEIHAAYMATRELGPQIDDMTDRLGALQSQENQAAEQMNLFAKAQEDGATALDKVVAETPEVAAALHSDYQSLTSFTDALNSMGKKAQELTPDQVVALANAWQGNMESIRPLMNEYGLKIEDLKHEEIGGIEFYLTDNGTIYDEYGRVQEFEELKIGNKTYYVDDKGTVKSSKKNLDNLKAVRLGDKTYIVSSDGTAEGEIAKLQGVRSVKVGDKHYMVTDDGSIYDGEERIGDLNNKKLVDKLFKVGDNETISKVEKKIDKLNSKTVKDRSFKITANDSDASSKISKYSGGGTLGTYVVNIVAKGSSTALKAAAKALGGSATGAISTGPIIPEHASGGLIPAHASGALNGIVAKPTLTNIGWVGEDGAEAILHMRNAGGAVIPLSNRRYVRPFARAVAGEMGAGNSTSVVNNINVSLTYDSTKEARQMAQDVANELNAILAMGA